MACVWWDGVGGGRIRIDKMEREKKRKTRGDKDLQKER